MTTAVKVNMMSRWGSPGMTACSVLSSMPSRRSTMVQQKVRLAPATLDVFGERERSGKAQQKAERRDPDAEPEGAAGQGQVEALAEVVDIVPECRLGDPVAEGRDGQEAEIEHGRKRQQHREGEPDIGRPRE